MAVLFDIYTLPTIHLSTYWLNNKVTTFYFHLSDLLALRMPGNSLQVDWSRGLLYIYPMLLLVTLALHNVVPEVLLMLQLLVDLQCCFQSVTIFLFGPDGLAGPDYLEFHLAAPA